MAKYVMSDIHGCFDEFNQMLDRICISRNDTLFLAGDCIDRGSQSLEMLHWLENCPKNVVPIKGNHDVEFVGYVRLMEQIDEKNELMTDPNSNEDARKLLDTIRYTFKRSYPLGLLFFDYYNTITDLITKRGVTMGELCRWADMIEKWPYYVRLEVGGRDVMVVHAGFCEEESSLPESHKTLNDFYLYAREEGLSIGGVENGMVIAGHTPTIIEDSRFYNNGKVYRYYDKEKDCIFYNIDCGCVFKEEISSGTLACIRVDDQKIFYLNEKTTSEIIQMTKSKELIWTLEKTEGPETIYTTFDDSYRFTISGEEKLVYKINDRECSQEIGEELLRIIKRIRPRSKNVVIIKSKYRKNQNSEKKKERKVGLPVTPYLQIQKEEFEEKAVKTPSDNENVVSKEKNDNESDIPVKQAPEKEKTVEPMTGIGYKDFLVRRSTFKCWNKNHHTKDLIATVNVLCKKNEKSDQREVRISAGYCEECGVYFIMESQYEKLKNIGIPMCRISDEKHYKNTVFSNGMLLSEESLLMQYGYNVNQNEGLTETVRHKVLASLIDHKIMTKADIISYLDFFISQRQSQPRYEMAISKWEIDREFVSEYHMGDYTKFGIRGIYRS